MGDGRWGGADRWRSAGRALGRVAVVWAVSTLTLLILAGLLPDFELQSPGGDTFTRTALTAAAAAGAFGLLGALVWPLIVRALLLVPALVLGLLGFFLNGSLLLVALWLIPDGRGAADPETAVAVAAVMSAVASATSTALAVRDDDAYRRRLYRLTGRTRPRAPGDAPEQVPGTVFLQLDGVGHHVLRGAVADGLMPTVAGWLDAGHRLTPWHTDWSSQTGASQLGILHGSNEDVPAFRWYEKDTGRVMVSNRPAGAVELQRRAVRRTGDGGCSPSTGPPGATSSAAAPTRSPWSCRWPPGAAAATARGPATSRTSPTRPTPSVPRDRSSPSASARCSSRSGRCCAARPRGCRAAARTPSSAPSRRSWSGTSWSPP